MNIIKYDWLPIQYIQLESFSKSKDILGWKQRQSFPHDFVKLKPTQRKGNFVWSWTSSEFVHQTIYSKR